MDEQKKKEFAKKLEEQKRKKPEPKEDMSLYDRLATGGYLGTMPKYEALKRTKGKQVWASLNDLYGPPLSLAYHYHTHMTQAAKSRLLGCWQLI